MSAVGHGAAVAQAQQSQFSNVTSIAPPKKARSDVYRQCLFLVVVFAVSKFPAYFGLLRAIRTTLVLVVVCGIYAALNRKKIASGSVFRTWPAKVIAGLGIITCLSVPFGLSMGHAGLFVLNNFGKTMILVALIISATRDAQDLRRLVWAFGLGGGVLAYLSIFVVGISKSSGAITYDANDVGLVMDTTLPIAVLMVHTSRTVRQRIVAVVCLLLIAATISKTQSRGAFIGLVAVGLGVLVLVPGISLVKRFAYMGAAAGVLALSAPPGYWIAMKSVLEDPKSDYNYDALNGRRMLAKRGMGYMLQYPFFGVGIDNFRVAEGTISDKARNAAPGTGVRWSAAHNSFVQAGAEAGIPGLVLFSSLLVCGVIGLTRLRRRLPVSWKRGNPDEVFLYFCTAYFPVALIGFAVTGFFVSFAWLEPYYILGALMAGIYTSVEVQMARGAGGATPIAGGSRVPQRAIPIAPHGRLGVAPVVHPIRPGGPMPPQVP